MSDLLRRALAEFVGTFFVVFAPVAFAASGEGGLLPAAMVSGLVVLVMVYALGPISAAHFNPAVTLGFAATGRFPWRSAPAYWLAQFTGGITAATAAACLFGGGHGMHVASVGFGAAIVVEAAITFVLMFVIMAVATDRRANAAVPGLSIGFAVVLGVLVGGKFTGGSMNPARSFGPALFAGGAALSSYWIYVVGPCLGALAGAGCYERLRGGEEFAVSHG